MIIKWFATLSECRAEIEEKESEKIRDLLIKHIAEPLIDNIYKKMELDTRTKNRFYTLSACDLLKTI